MLVGLGKKDVPVFQQIYKSVGVPCEVIENLESAFERISNDPPTLIVAQEPDHSGMLTSLNTILKKESPTTPFLVSIKRNHADKALEAMRAGAYDCLAPPYGRLDVLASSKRATLKNGRTLFLSKVNRPKRRVGRLLMALGLTFLFGFFLHHQVHGPPPHLLVLDSKFLSGIQWENRNLWVGDWFHATVTKFELETGIIKKTRDLKTDSLYRMKDGQPILICNTPDAFISIGTDLKMRSHQWEVGLPVLQTIDTPGTQPGGLSWDGSHLWSSDTSNGFLYRYDHFFRVLDSKKSLIPNPGAIAWGGDRLWVVGGKPLKAAILEKVESGYVWRGPYLMADWIPADKNVTGVSVGFGRLWVSVEGDSRVVSKPLSDIEKNQIPWKVSEKKRKPEKDEKETLG